jgi:hypothetical protein
MHGPDTLYFVFQVHAELTLETQIARSPSDQYDFR